MNKKFFAAIQSGDRREVAWMLEAYPEFIDATDENGLSAILVAAYNQQAEIASLLAERRVLLTIFEAAALGKITHIIRILAKQPELAEAINQDGFQPLNLAALFGHYDAAEYLLQAGAPVNTPSQNNVKATPLHSAAAGQNAKIVELLIKHGADINRADNNGFTPLHSAAQNGHAEIIRLLLQNGADPHAKTNAGKTALNLAAEAGHAEAVDMLKSKPK